MTSDILNNIGIGAITTWDLRGTRVTPQRMRDLLTNVGMHAEASAVPDIDQVAAVRRVAQTWSAGRGTDRYRTEVVEDTGTALTIGVLRRERIGQKEVAWTQQEVLVYSEASGWTATGSLQASADFISSADDARTYLDHNYIRPFLQGKMQQMKAFPLRKQGGAYFVAGVYDAELQDVQQVVGAIGDSSFNIFHLARTEQTQASLHEGARSHVGGQLQELQAKMAGWQDRATKVRSDAVDNAIAEAMTIKADATFYAQTLQVALDDLLADLDQVLADANALADAAFEANPGEKVERARKERSSSAVRPGTALDAAVKVLQAHPGVELTVHDICGLALDQGWNPTGSTIELTMEARLCLAARDGRAGITRGAAPRTFTLKVEAPVVEEQPEAPVALPSSEPQAEEPQAQADSTVEYSVEALEEMPMAQMVKLAKERGIKGASKMRRSALLEAVAATLAA